MSDFKDVGLPARGEMLKGKWCLITGASQGVGHKVKTVPLINFCLPRLPLHAASTCSGILNMMFGSCLNTCTMMFQLPHSASVDHSAATDTTAPCHSQIAEKFAEVRHRCQLHEYAGVRMSRTDAQNQTR